MVNQQVCKQCGTTIPLHHTFCFQCGAALATQTSPPTAAPTGVQASATQGQSSSSQEDFLSKYGKSIVVIVFSLLIGDTISTVIQKGSDPDVTFFAIAFVTLPYTAAMVSIFCIWMYDPYEEREGCSWIRDALAGSGLLLILGFFLGSLVHWGISDPNGVIPRVIGNIFTHPGYFLYKFIIVGVVLVIIYVHIYSIQVFLPATLASFVIAWNILKPKKVQPIIVGVVVLFCVTLLAYFAASLNMDVTQFQTH